MGTLSGKTALVTGSTDGVGRLVALKLGQAGAHVLVHGRDAERGARVVTDIAASGGAGTFLAADLSRLAEVSSRRCGPGDDGPARHPDQQCRHRHRCSPPDQRRGVRAALCSELSRRVSTYLAAVAACQEQRAGADRQRLVGRTAADRFRRRHADSRLCGRRAYCQSKLAQIMFTIDLAAALEDTGVTVTCLHPATYMDRTMVRRAGVTPLSTVEEGAQAILNLATSPGVEGQTGVYFNGLREARAQAQAYDADARRRLKAISLELTGLSAECVAACEARSATR